MQSQVAPATSGLASIPVVPSCRSPPCPSPPCRSPPCSLARSTAPPLVRHPRSGASYSQRTRPHPQRSVLVHSPAPAGTIERPVDDSWLARDGSTPPPPPLGRSGR